MKHLKLFKEINKDDFYTEIKDGTWLNYTPSWGEHEDIIINMPRINIEYIRNLFKDKKYKKFNIIKIRDASIPEKYNLEISVNNDSLYPENSKLSEILITITELADEYFIVSFEIPNIHDGNVYKCDQIDGVKELLQDLKLI